MEKKMNIDKNSLIVIVAVVVLAVGYYLGSMGGSQKLDMEKIIELDRKCEEYGKSSESSFGRQGIFWLKYRYSPVLDTCIKDERRLWYDSIDTHGRITDLYSNSVIIEYDDRCGEKTNKLEKCYSEEEYKEKLDEILKR